MSMMNKENFNSNEEPVFTSQEFGSSYFDKKRQEWNSKDQQKKPLPDKYQQFEELEDDDKEKIYEIIVQVKPPFEPFQKYIKLQDLIECLTDIWS